MNKSVKGILFVIHLLAILMAETMKYFIYNDYYEFIDKIAIRLSSINILYVKIFQAISLNNSFIDCKTNAKLMKFVDNVPFSLSDICMNDLRKMTAQYEITLNDETDILPVNSGMISLVFIGVDTVNKKRVVIKMKRDNIEEKLDDAIDNLVFLSYLLSFIPMFTKYNITDIVCRNIEFVRQQTNFITEVDNMNKIRENCKNLKYVKIPTANRNITEEYPNIIVMDYISGKKINEIDTATYDKFSKLVVKFGIVTTIIHGVVHGDLHGGNIIFIEDQNDSKYPYKIGIIDFGIIFELENKSKELLYDIFTTLFEISPKETAVKILDSGIIESCNLLSPSSRDKICVILEDILTKTITESKKANQIHIYKTLNQINECLSCEEIHQYDIRPSDEFVKLQLIMAMTHGVTLTLCNNDFITLMDDTINELFHITSIV